MKPLPWVRTALVAAVVCVSPIFGNVSAQNPPGVVISEFRFRGPAGSGDEFVELFNAGTRPVDITGWTLRGSTDTTFTVRAEITTTTFLHPGCHFLLVGGSYVADPLPLGDPVPGNLSYTPNFTDSASMAIFTKTGLPVDQVRVNGSGIYGEGQALLLPPPGLGYERKPAEAVVYQDTNNNFDDFQVANPATPQNADPSCLAAQPTIFTAHEVQGAGATSPLTGNTATVRGVVTAVTSDGFFIQAESGAEDADPNTSEGLFVVTSSSAAVGDVVDAEGTVQEHADLAGGATVTRLYNATASKVAGPVPLPAPVVLTAADLSPSGPADQLERFEGMRVTAPSLMTVSGTAGDGSFYAVLGNQRPFREPGIEVGSPALECATPPCAFATFDGNPERLRVDSDGVAGTTGVNLWALETLTDVTGPLHYAANAYTVLPEVSLPVSPAISMPMTGLPATPADQYSVASLNFGDPSVSLDTRLDKATLMVQATLNRPDVIAVQNADQSSLDKLAAQAGGYTAVLGGFLLKTDRVAVVNARAFDSDLFARQPLLLEVVINGGSLVLPQHLTLLATELRSLADVGLDNPDGQAARAQRQAQAEFIAEEIRNRQINDPSEALVVLGNFNAFEFNDGYVDVVGTIAGTPAPGDQVVLASQDRVPYDLVNLIGTLLPAERYSSVANGNAQSLDHVLISGNLSSQLWSFTFARANADFPDVLRADETTAWRLSDRDPAVAYFAFPPDVNAPVFDFLPQDIVAEATDADGAVVTYNAPTATDNLDVAVVVSCTPESGSVFPLDNTAVECSTRDAAGNTATAWFTVTVQDTTPPVLLVPTDISDAADSPAGRIVEYSVSASDAVTAVPTITCSPVSGSMFPLGMTTVNCQASDDAGNSSAVASFTVTIGEPVLGRMHGGGQITVGGNRVTFVFEVRESPNYVERGRLLLHLKGEGQPGQLLAATVSDVRFSDPQGSVTFRAYGTWDGKPGYRFDVAASDQADPGVSADTLQVIITAPTGEVVATVSGVLTRGNIQVR